MKRLKVGDVFTVPVGDGRAGVGQIVGAYGKRAYYFAIFASVFPLEEAESRIDEALQGRLLLLALSVDAKIYVGDWVVLGSAPVSAAIPLPAYKAAVGFPPRYDVVDYSGKRRRRATQHEAAAFPNRTVVAPIRLETALRADLGLEPWVEEFDELRAERVITTAEAFRQRPGTAKRKIRAFRGAGWKRRDLVSSGDCKARRKRGHPQDVIRTEPLRAQFG